MTSNSKRGHDPLFKLFLREPETARDFLEAHLPEDIRSLVHLDTLRLESGSYVDEELKELHSDILYSVKMAEDAHCLLYCIVEHQSTEDEMMAWRMTKYTIRAMNDHLKKGYRTLPVVVPLLFYHGDVRPYPYSMDWLDCFEQPELARRVLSKPWPLIDVSVLDDDDIKTHRRMALLEMVQRDIRLRDGRELLGCLVQLIQTGLNSREQVEAVLRYTILNGMAGEDISPYINQLSGDIPEYEDLMDTIAQQLIRKGAEQERQASLERERAILEQERQASLERERRTLLDAARALIDNGVSPEVVMKTMGLSREELEQPRH
ncbi:Rpn family recombination-promoting nuclease/putative transposase [Salmonella enterica subsp. enterica]|uniref:Rpn family recombination-promoting nuclease/putative transposase n=1 Tax=Salmonella enterica subsp. enterica serovar Java TaxID=224729 RepID=A0A5X0ZDI4_SALEB|nr:Rpn family recombination-promoting nuclease/putative transposase [Salmonella enterica subsp. enterica serovar Java]EEP4266577.1 Rpn family recombination-promoting nuclease/putative transposase [Salmonella enterica subsp. enterica serovar Oranienburg]EGO9988919.1 Rpn family recombination-promoting nuclease/putative transposase [Salmonella enterica]EEP8814654.1 Rpn family recombination-promoting nuclease/putative transposase [Salmonella enterica subsp. enterica serovar Oranienburg]EJK8886002.1